MAQSINPARNKAKLTIQQGSDFSLVFDLSNFTTSLVGATGRGQIRQTVSSAGSECSFTCTVDSGTSEMTVNLPGSTSAALTLDTSTTSERTITTWCYDIELVFSDNTPVRLLWGEVDIIPEATR